MQQIPDHHERFSHITPERDIYLLRRAFALAAEGRKNGNHPFGALLADAEGNILLEQTNVEVSENDATCHAETALARRASNTYTKAFLSDCTLYTSAEPCCMCTGAVYWTNIGRIVYALSEEELLAETGNDEKNPTFNLDCRTVLSRGQKAIVVQGPYPELKEEALKPFEDYWTKH